MQWESPVCLLSWDCMSFVGNPFWRGSHSLTVVCKASLGARILRGVVLGRKVFRLWRFFMSSLKQHGTALEGGHRNTFSINLFPTLPYDVDNKTTDARFCAKLLRSSKKRRTATATQSSVQVPTQESNNVHQQQRDFSSAKSVTMPATNWSRLCASHRLW